MTTRRPIRLAAASRVRADADARLVPLINIVFLMLIFFMLAGSVRSPDPIALDRPYADASGRQGAEAIRVLVTGPAVFVGATEVALAALPSALRDRLTRHGAGDARSIEIHVDRRLPFARLAPVLDAVRQAGPDGIRLVTQRAP